MINNRDKAIILERMRHSKRLMDNQQLDQLIMETEQQLGFLLGLQEHEPDARRAQVLEELTQQHEQLTAIREKNVQLVDHMPDYEKVRVLETVVSRMDNDPLFHQQLVAALRDITGAKLVP